MDFFAIPTLRQWMSKSESCFLDRPHAVFMC